MTTQLTVEQHEQAVKIAVYGSAQKAGISPSSFDVELKPSLVMRVHIRRRKDRLVVTFGISIVHPEFGRILGETIPNIAKMKSCVALQKLSLAADVDAWVEKHKKTSGKLSVLHASEYEVVCLRKVVVKHKKSGLIATAEGPESVRANKTWTDLVLDAKKEVTATWYKAEEAIKHDKSIR